MYGNESNDMIDSERFRLLRFKFTETLDLPPSGCCLVTTPDDSRYLRESDHADTKLLDGHRSHPFFGFEGWSVWLSDPPSDRSPVKGLHLKLDAGNATQVPKPSVKDLFPLLAFVGALLETEQTPIREAWLGPSLLPMRLDNSLWSDPFEDAFMKSALQRLILTVPEEQADAWRTSINAHRIGLEEAQAPLGPAEVERDDALRACLAQLKREARKSYPPSWSLDVRRVLAALSDSINAGAPISRTLTVLAMDGRMLVEAVATSVVPRELRFNKSRPSVRALIEEAAKSGNPELIGLLKSYMYCLKNIGNANVHVTGETSTQWELPLVYCLLSLLKWMTLEGPLATKVDV